MLVTQGQRAIRTATVRERGRYKCGTRSQRPKKDMHPEGVPRSVATGEALAEPVDSKPPYPIPLPQNGGEGMGSLSTGSAAWGRFTRGYNPSPRRGE